MVVFPTEHLEATADRDLSVAGTTVQGRDYPPPVRRPQEGQVQREVRPVGALREVTAQLTSGLPGERVRQHRENGRCTLIAQPRRRQPPVTVIR